MKTYKKRPGTADAARYTGPAHFDAGWTPPEAPEGVQFSPEDLSGMRQPYVLTGNGQAVFLRSGDWVVRDGSGWRRMSDAEFRAEFEECPA